MLATNFWPFLKDLLQLHESGESQNQFLAKFKASKMNHVSGLMKFLAKFKASKMNHVSGLMKSMSLESSSIPCLKTGIPRRNSSGGDIERNHNAIDSLTLFVR